MNEAERNRRVAQAVHRDFAWAGRTFQPGDFVAVLDGNVVAVAANADDAIAALRAIDPDPRRGMVLEVAPPTVDVIRRAR
jgi:hypothetical protein